MSENKLMRIGVIPAAGLAKRLGLKSGSKELISIGNQTNGRPIPVSAFMLKNFKAAQTTQVAWVIRKGKWDIPEEFGSGLDWNMDMSYHIMEHPFGPPFSLYQAYQQFRDKIVLLGFPDILIDHPNPYARLIEKLETTEAEVALGIVKTESPQLVDVIQTNAAGMVQKIIPKPTTGNWSQAWIWATWKPGFSDFLKMTIDRILGSQSLTKEVKDTEFHMGHLFQKFIDEGGVVTSEFFPKVKYLDIGTPDGLNSANHFVNMMNQNGKNDRKG